MSSFGLSNVNLGPLTTTFVAPPSCATPLAGQNDLSQASFYAAQTCTAGKPKDALSCWPSSTTSVSQFPPGFYSPGLICPAGYTSACTQVVPSSGAQSVTDINPNSTFIFDFEPSAGETAIGCCPTGFKCGRYFRFNSNAWQSCLSYFRTGYISVGSCSGTASYPNEVTRVSAGLQGSLVYAPMFQLKHQSSDLSGASIPSQTDTSSGQISANAENSSTLSNGAKIGIGIGVPLAVIFVVALGTILCIRRRRNGARRGGLLGFKGLTEKEDALRDLHEAPGQWDMVSELPITNPTTVHEMPVASSPR